MNPANFQNMQAQAMPPQPAPQPAASSNNVAHVQQLIMQSLQQQAPIQGWQSGVQIQTRGNIIIQMSVTAPPSPPLMPWPSMLTPAAASRSYACSSLSSICSTSYSLRWASKPRLSPILLIG